jgi:hypothetical protein
LQHYFLFVKIFYENIITSKLTKMSDQTNPTQPIINPEEEEIVKDEEEVHGAYMNNEVSDKEVEEIDTIPELEQKAEQIKLEEGLGTLAAPDTTQALAEEPVKVELPQVEKKEEIPPAPAAPSAPEVQEPKQEVVAEVKQEVAPEAPNEAKSEIGKI